MPLAGAQTIGAAVTSLAACNCAPMASVPRPIEIPKEALEPPPDDTAAVQAQIVGKGAFGYVYAAKLASGNETLTVAVKKLVIPGVNMDEKCLAEMKHESSVMQMACHPNIVYLYGVITDPKCPAIVMEYLPKSLWHILQDVFKGSASEADRKLSWPQRLHVVHGIASGMAFLHSLRPPMAHRDLKAANVLLDTKMHPKLIDFGMARIKAESARMSTVSGTPQWMAPEMFESDRYDPLKCDVYAFAMTLFELYTGKTPFHEIQRVPVVIKKICEGSRPGVGPRPSGCPPAFIDLMQRCWHQNPKNRPTFSEILTVTKAWDLGMPDPPKVCNTTLSRFTMVTIIGFLFVHSAAVILACLPVRY